MRPTRVQSDEIVDLPAQRFDARVIRPFVERSLSEATRRTYGRTIREFFAFADRKHPADVRSDDIRAWRDLLIRYGKRPATVALKLSVLRSLFEYLKAAGVVDTNPASSRLVPPPPDRAEQAGRALSSKEVSYLLAGPDRKTAVGARDYALLVVLLRLGLRAAEACGLRRSSMRQTKGRWVVQVRVKGGRERTLPLPEDVKAAIDTYLALDRKRRELVHSGGAEAYLFQPEVNPRTLVFDRPLTTRMVGYIVRRWAEFGGIGKLSPHDLRRTAITKALDQGLSYRQVQMMSGHRDPKTVMRYDHGRENLDLNAVNFLTYEE